MTSVLERDKLRDKHWWRNLFGRHGNSRTTFEGGTARNVKCRTTFQQSAVDLSAVHPEELGISVTSRSQSH